MSFYVSIREKQEEFGFAASRGDIETVMRLATDPDVNPDGHFGEPLRWASTNGHAAVVAFLLQDPRVFPSSSSNLCSAAKYGHLDVVSLLLQDVRIDPTWEFNRALCDAIEEGHVAVVERFLADPRIDPRYYSPQIDTLLSHAARYGHHQIISVLLKDPRIDPSEDENLALRKAVYHRRIECVKELLEDSRIDPSVGNPIEIASMYPDLGIMAHLIANPRVYTSPLHRNVTMFMPYVMPYFVERAWSRRRHVVLGRARRWL